MANLALGKIPLESKVWQSPEQATNGIVSGYDGKNGFASAPWPCTYTIDLEVECKIDTIRFLLWDNLGKQGNSKNERKYKFNVSVSSDGESYHTFYSNQNEAGDNGWFSFGFLNALYARFVRLTGHFNSVNGKIHLVEFEIHDNSPARLNSSNVHHFSILTGIPSEHRINELVEKTISAKSEKLGGVEVKIKQLDSALEQYTQHLKQIEIIRRSHGYETEAGKNNNRAIRWLAASVGTLAVFVTVLLWFIYRDETAVRIIETAAYNENVKPFTGMLLGAYLVSKALLLSTILFLLGWFLKNYRSEKHNFIINKHKAMTLTVATGILTKEDYREVDRANVFVQAMEIIFSHQTSGFSKDDGSSPSIVNTLFQKGLPPDG